MKLSDGLGQVKDIMATLEKGVDPHEDGVILRPPGVGWALSHGSAFVLEVNRLEVAQHLGARKGQSCVG